LHNEDWSGAVEKHYGVHDLGALQNTWLAWVSQGSPLVRPRQPANGGESLAAAERRPRPEPNLIYRERESRPEGKLALVPVHLPGTGVVTGDGTPTVPARRPAPSTVAANVPQSPPKALPSSGWHAPGAAVGSVASSSPPPDASVYREEVSHPQPVEQPR
jgi:hypothetical protein